jgi:hypothetical protein
MLQSGDLPRPTPISAGVLRLRCQFILKPTIQSKIDFSFRMQSSNYDAGKLWRRASKVDFESFPLQG